LSQLQHILIRKAFMILSKYSVSFLENYFSLSFECDKKFFKCSIKRFLFFELSIVYTLITSSFVSVWVFIQLFFLLKNEKKTKNFKKKFKIKSYLSLSFVFSICFSS
jgi:hypothetical protein